jgi:hypothetical protein
VKGAGWVQWSLGFLAGAVLATFLALSCGVGQAQSPEVAAAIASAAQAYGVPEGTLRCLAWRESRFWPGAYNPAGYHGLYQYDWPTWAYASRLAGYEGWSPYSPWAAAHTTALLIVRGEGRRWPPLRGC